MAQDGGKHVCVALVLMLSTCAFAGRSNLVSELLEPKKASQDDIEFEAPTPPTFPSVYMVSENAQPDLVGCDGAIPQLQRTGGASTHAPQTLPGASSNLGPVAIPIGELATCASHFTLTAWAHDHMHG